MKTEINKLTSESTIAELSEVEGLNKKLQNICKSNKIYTLQELLSYYQAYKSFRKFKNCGMATNSLIIELCLKYSHLYNPENDKLKELLVPPVNQANIIKDFTLEVAFSFDRISKRTISLCKAHNINTIKDVVDYYKENNFSYRALTHTGRIAEYELKELYEKYCIYVFK